MVAGGRRCHDDGQSVRISGKVLLSGAGLHGKGCDDGRDSIDWHEPRRIYRCHRMILKMGSIASTPDTRRARRICFSFRLPHLNSLPTLQLNFWNRLQKNTFKDASKSNDYFISLLIPVFLQSLT